MNGITQSTALWYASRATGIVSLVLLSAVMVLGILVNRQGRLPGLPRFAVTGLHRSISLLALVFLAVHVLSAVADKYVSIRLAAVFIPFASSYQPVATGLGAVALDLGAAVAVTSLLRARIGRRLWRGVHWLAYASYPVAVIHSVTSATDLRSGGLLALTIACVLGVTAAAGYRVISAARARAQRTRPAQRYAPDAAGAARRPGHARATGSYGRPSPQAGPAARALATPSLRTAALAQPGTGRAAGAAGSPGRARQADGCPVSAGGVPLDPAFHRVARHDALRAATATGDRPAGPVRPRVPPGRPTGTTRHDRHDTPGGDEEGALR
jgi:methionine sulfoxide reductase heme-binding subunit